MMLKHMERKSSDPKLLQKEISKQLGFSDSTIKRYRDGINMASLYNGNNYIEKNRKSNTSIIQTQNQTLSENTKNNRSTKIIKRAI